VTALPSLQTIDDQQQDERNNQHNSCHCSGTCVVVLFQFANDDEYNDDDEADNDDEGYMSGGDEY
jgi:hypothetical protein